MVDIANPEGKKIQVYFTSKSVRIKKVEKMKIFAYPSYNQHKIMLATSSALNEYWLISLLRDKN